MEWKEVTLGELGTIVGGATPSTKNPSFYDGNIPWLTPKDLSVNSNKYILRGERNITEAGFKSCSCKILPKGSVLFSSRAPIGYVAIAANDMCTNQGFKSVIPNEETDSEFLYYLLKYNKDYIASQGSGTTFAEVSGKTMKDIEVVVPKEKEDQRRIASILSSLDRKIELNNKINADLEEMAQAIFKNWFVDFEPFKDGKFVDSELGMIPEGWKVGTLEDLIAIKYGKDHKKLEEGSFPVYGSGGLMRFVNSWLYDGESVLIPRKGTLDNIMYVCEKFWTVDTMFFSAPKMDYVMKYVYNYIKRFDFSKMNEGTSVPSNTAARLNKMQILIPTLEVLKMYDETLCPIYNKRKMNDKESRTLSTLRDTLLPRLMSGEIEVPE